MRRFARDPHGSVTVEFTIVAPLLIGFIVFAVELGMLAMHAAMLERGLDIAVREVRLGTGTAPGHDDIKRIVCDNAPVIADCGTRLRLEMIPTDLRSFATLDTTPDCTDTSEPSRPVRTFIPGGQNQLMLLRACLKYKPLFPEAILGDTLTKDSAGDVALTTVSAFVQEPI
ncbi:TadE/TadG family type IV pilus assembly protein [Roseovarius ramblicola]|uniref:TadE/TadG family type IV pilus assembly protein n=1 Tax=Roseovarius ramblicola TaxID=2022336 RepID=A0ABV5I0A2_9RHOB